MIQGIHYIPSGNPSSQHGTRCEVPGMRYHPP